MSMKIIPILIVLSLVSLPMFAFSASVNKFQSGASEVVADLFVPGQIAVVNITVPADWYVLNATMKVISAPS